MTSDNNGISDNEDFEDLKEFVSHNKQLIKSHRRNIMILEQQAAEFGSLYVPPYIKNQINDINTSIVDCQNAIDSKIKPKLVALDKKLNHDIDELEFYEGFIRELKGFLSGMKEIDKNINFVDTLVNEHIGINLSKPQMVLLNSIEFDVFIATENYVNQLITQMEEVMRKTNELISSTLTHIEDLKRLQYH